MLRKLALIILVAAAVNAAVLPEQFGEYRRGEISQPALENAPVWKEFGLEVAERAVYNGAPGSFTLTAYRLKDPTGAFAAFQWQRPANAQSALTSASTPNGSLIQHHNYLLQFEGGKPHPSTLEALYKQLPEQMRSSLPVLHEYLPRKGRIANSERYVLGPQSLTAFEPRIPPSLAGFNKGAEAQIARYRAGGREIALTILSYPTPQIAMERLAAFGALAQATVRRTGPMLVVAPETSQVAAAKPLVEDVNYSASLTWSEEVPKATVQDAAEMILAIAMLALGLIVSALLLGMFFGGSRFILRSLGMKVADEELTTLHLSGR